MNILFQNCTANKEDHTSYETSSCKYINWCSTHGNIRLRRDVDNNLNKIHITNIQSASRIDIQDHYRSSGKRIDIVSHHDQNDRKRKWSVETLCWFSVFLCLLLSANIFNACVRQIRITITGCGTSIKVEIRHRHGVQDHFCLFHVGVLLSCYKKMRRLWNRMSHVYHLPLGKISFENFVLFALKPLEKNKNRSTDQKLFRKEIAGK